MRLLTLGLWLFALPALALDSKILVNDREGKSFYASKSSLKAINRTLETIGESDIKGAFDEALKETTESRVCSFDLLGSIEAKLKSKNAKFKDLDGVILYLRYKDMIDDSVVRILKKARATSTTRIQLPKDGEGLRFPAPEILDPALDEVERFEESAKNKCHDEAYANFYSSLLKINKRMKNAEVEAILARAYEQKRISFPLYLKLERSRVNELQLVNLTLKQYVKKIKSLRLQYPLRDPSEKTNFVTEKMHKMKLSRREALIENYSDIQIILMANVVKSLRTRLESRKAEILIYAPGEEEVETITLEPMERFRLAIKLLRKEMSKLALNSYFDGRAPSYMDLMTSAYEVGLIPASELEEVAGLEEIWNPKKTFWDRAMVWVRTLSSVATIAVPPPYGFVPALAVVVIELISGQDNENGQDETVLF